MEIRGLVSQRKSAQERHVITERSEEPRKSITRVMQSLLRERPFSPSPAFWLETVGRRGLLLSVCNSRDARVITSPKWNEACPLSWKKQRNPGILRFAQNDKALVSAEEFVLN